MGWEPSAINCGVPINCPDECCLKEAVTVPRQGSNIVTTIHCPAPAQLRSYSSFLLKGCNVLTAFQRPIVCDVTVSGDWWPYLLLLLLPNWLWRARVGRDIHHNKHQPTSTYLLISIYTLYMSMILNMKCKIFHELEIFQFLSDTLYILGSSV